MYFLVLQSFNQYLLNHLLYLYDYSNYLFFIFFELIILLKFIDIIMTDFIYYYLIIIFLINMKPIL
jgi:hypothetical protein